ncbi:MAG: hypothetical protein WC343_02340 [Bacilli bacterium]|jgi:hypothetical protein
MKWNREKFNEFRKSKYMKPLLFFAFYIVFFAVVFSMAGNSSNDNEDEKQTNMWDKMNDNYEYLYNIKTGSGDIITLEGKKYNNKNLFTKSINGVLDSEVYIFYEDVSVKEDAIWTSPSAFTLVDESFNSQYLNANYIEELISDAELVDSITNFDESISETYTVDGLTIEVTSGNQTLTKITIIHPIYNITLQYKKINKVVDFVVEK